jgi:hypothetical protein
MKGKTFFCAGIIPIALTGAITTHTFLSPDGYSRQVDFLNQQILCEPRTYCDTQGYLPCTFENVRLYDMTCTIQLNRVP